VENTLIETTFLSSLQLQATYLLQAVTLMQNLMLYNLELLSIAIHSQHLLLYIYIHISSKLYNMRFCMSVTACSRYVACNCKDERNVVSIRVFSTSAVL